MRFSATLALGFLLALAPFIAGCPGIPPNACSLNNGNCDPHAFCSDVQGLAECSCFPGFTGPGTVCTPISPCTENEGACDPHATCVAAGAVSVCMCTPGFIGDGYHCDPPPSCSLGNGGCDPNAICTEIANVISCACMEPFVGNGYKCEECTSTACGPNSECTANADAGTIECQCQPGYFVGDGGIIPTPPNELCAPANNCIGNTVCDPHASCTPTDGGNPICTCDLDAGYVGDGGSCVQVSMCAVDGGTGGVDCGANAICTDTESGAVCTCLTGFSMKDGGCLSSWCELDLDNCDPNAMCTDTPTSYTCVCDTGYMGDGGMCTAINACAKDPCGANQNCTPTGPDTYSCACTDGYKMGATADGGMACLPVNPCQASKSPCTDPNATCQYDGPGMFSCPCDTNYEEEANGDAGMACEPVNHCNDTPSVCPVNGMCTYTGPGTYSCTCDTGYKSSNDQCVPIDHCDDVPSVCDPNAACKYTGPGTYTCTCNAGFTGDGTTCQAHYLQVAIGDTHICAIRADNSPEMNGSMYCWGWNDSGQLGNGMSDTTAPIQTPVPVSNPTINRWIAVAAGSEATCGIQTDNSLWCWGSNINGQLGVGSSSESDFDTPNQIGQGLTWTSVVTEGNHSCAVAEPGNVYCWGLNGNGQLGLGSGAPDLESSPNEVQGSNGTYATVGVGTQQTCAMRGFSILCWGSNEYGQDAQCPQGGSCSPTVMNEDAPTVISAAVPPSDGSPPGTNPWQAVFVGPEDACGIQSNDNSLWCWGENNRGQVGIVSQPLVTPQPAPVNVGSSGNSATWAAAALGTSHACGIQVGGSIYCWGDNTNGQLGIGMYTSYSLTPVAVVLPESEEGIVFQRLVANAVYTCAIDTSNDLWCWGEPPTTADQIYSFGTQPTLVTK